MFNKQSKGKESAKGPVHDLVPPRAASNLVPFTSRRATHSGMGDDVEMPTVSDIDFEWSPEKPGEMLEGQVVKIATMQLGGLAVTLHLADEQWEPQRHKDGHPVIVLFKKGGAIFLNRLEAFEPPVGSGDFLRIRYEGEIPAKKAGHNPAREFTVARRRAV